MKEYHFQVYGKLRVCGFVTWLLPVGKEVLFAGYRNIVATGEKRKYFFHWYGIEFRGRKNEEILSAGRCTGEHEFRETRSKENARQRGEYDIWADGVGLRKGLSSGA